MSVATVVVDLADAKARATVANELELYALVNNAGYLNAGLLRNVAMKEARRQLEVMVLAPMDLARQALPCMLLHGDGRIVNVTSSAAHPSTPFSGWYQSSKAALRELNDALRVKLHNIGVDVIDVEPGGYQTGFGPLTVLRDSTEVIEVHPPDLLTLEARFRPVGVMNVEFHIEPDADGTQLTVEEYPVGGLIALPVIVKAVDALVALRNVEMGRRICKLVEKRESLRETAGSGG